MDTNTTMDTNASLLRSLANNWWVLLLRGLAGIGFGVVAFMWPGITLVSMILLFGVFAAVGGVLEIIAAIRGGTMLPRWWLAMAGVIALGAAAITFLDPHVTALILIYIIGGWAFIHGIFEIIGAIRIRKMIRNEWALILSGVLSALFGIMVMLRPGAGALGLVWMIGAIAFVTGILFTYFAFKLRRLKFP
jgi:uncharacterized membrane protein HdeD (DUF308 family)